MDFFGEEKNPSVLVWGGRGLTFSILACMGLCFGFVLRLTLVTQAWFHSC